MARIICKGYSNLACILRPAVSGPPPHIEQDDLVSWWWNSSEE